MVTKNTIPSQSRYFERFLIKTIPLFIFLLLFSCTDDEDAIVVNQSVDVLIDNKQFQLINNDFLIVENCNDLFIDFIYDKPENHFMMSFILSKKGELKHISLLDFRRSSSFYRTPDFNPLRLMAITNFKYDDIKKSIFFDFNGELIKTINGIQDMDTPKEKLKIKGTVNTNNIKTEECSIFIPDLTFEIPELKFVTTKINASFNPNISTNSYIFRYYSNNGYRILIKSKNDLWNLDKGVYPFNENSAENRIDLEQYIGIIRASDSGTYSRDIDWKKYQTAGSYTILEHVIINGQKVTKGEMNLKVYDNGVLIHTITKGKFEVTGFN
ncbi:conserved hypothetical protein [Flavobacterium sp. 9R]|nr:conserved hypothetical protein [Flavobacterium sp. 9R]